MSTRDLDDSGSSDDERIGPSSPVEQDTCGMQQQTAPTLQIPINPLHLTRDASGSNASIFTPKHDGSPGQYPKRTGIARFRAAARKIIHMKAMTKPIGGEPGIDVRKSSAALLYSHIYESCHIQVSDYSESKFNLKVLDNRSFQRWIKGPEFEKKSWIKVRWINVGGLSWDVVSQLGLTYGLHPLALEDLLHDRRLARSKADYYAKQLFLRIVCHQLEDDENVDSSIIPELERSGSPLQTEPEPLNDKVHYTSFAEDKEEVIPRKFMRRRLFNKQRSTHRPSDFEASIQTQRGSFDSSATLNEDIRQKAVDRVTLQNLKKGDNINVALKNMCIFLLSDGTVISFHRDANLQFTHPIALRLQQRETSLRMNSDPSMLVHALLDLVVDKALEVMDAYHERIVALERQTLMKPKLSTVRSLHIISGDLIMHKRTMEPLKHLVYGLRRYDFDRCMAMQLDIDPSIDKSQVRGFMSHKAKVYLADVVDHVDHLLSSMDMFIAITENLMNYTFNVNSSQTNEIMRRFTIVTIICLPLTLLTGYFGMNFKEDFKAINHSDAFFWIIAVPVVTVVILVSLWSDFQRMFHYCRKILYAKQIAGEYRRRR